MSVWGDPILVGGSSGSPRASGTGLYNMAEDEMTWDSEAVEVEE